MGMANGKTMAFALLVENMCGYQEDHTDKLATKSITRTAQRWTDNERKVHIRMIKENGKIKEISENEAFCMFIDNEYYMAMDFYEFRSRLEEAGAKITKN